MADFPGAPSELVEATEYEVGAINELRVILHRQSEAVGDGMAVTLGNYGTNGRLLRHLFMSCHMSVSEDAVRRALGQLRPLAFSAAFKIHDMIVEWILRANAVTVWPFQQKLAAYDSLGSALVEPELFKSFPALSRAFWELFRFFVPFRGSVVHRGGVSLAADSSVIIVRDNRTLRLSVDEQAAYMRATCLLVQMLSQQSPTTSYQRDLLENDLHGLRHYHGVQGLQERCARLEILTVTVPEGYASSQSPCSFQVDFDELRDLMHTSFPLAAPGSLYYSVVVVAPIATRELTWTIPSDSLPTGRVLIREGDPAFDQFLRIGCSVAESA